MNIVFLLLAFCGLVAMTVVNPDAVFPTMIKGASDAIALAFKLLAIYSVWLSVLNMLEKTSLDKKLSKMLSPLTKRLFKGESATAQKYISINMASNMLGMGGAATPAGIKAMKEMDDLSGKATHNMKLLLVLSATSLQLIPATVIALRGDGGSANPSDILLPTLIATSVSTLIGVILCKVFAKISKSVKKEK